MNELKPNPNQLKYFNKLYPRPLKNVALNNKIDGAGMSKPFDTSIFKDKIIIGDGQTYWQKDDERYVSIYFPSYKNRIWILKSELWQLKELLEAVAAPVSEDK